ncbi:MAG TPA: hypothetical protein VKE74_02545, partial [Gemmataceae bacterium]|nr:hypothetical protein [Gemmataceae bacterium]
IRVRFTIRLRPFARLVVGLGLLAAGSLAVSLGWAVATGAVGGMLGAAGVGWWRGTHRAARAVAVFDHTANKLGLLRCGTGVGRDEVTRTGGTA